MAAAQNRSIFVLTVLTSSALIVLSLLGTLLFPAPAALGFAGDWLSLMPILVAASTALYAVLRRGEGDFHALFIVSFAIFLGAEGINALMLLFGLTTLGGLSTLFNFTLFLYSSFAMTAGSLQSDDLHPYQRSLRVANLGFMFVASVRTFLLLRSPMPSSAQNIVNLAALGGLTVWVAALLYRGERLENSQQRGNFR